MRYAHLSAGFMLTSIIGFLVSLFFVMKLDPTWGFTFMLFFVIMFVSSIISMTKASYSEKEYQEELAVHEQIHHPKVHPRLSSDPLPVRFNTLDSFVMLFAVCSLFYMMLVTFTGTIITPAVLIIMLAITLILTMWLVVDAFASERLTTGQQLGYTLLMIALGGLGVAIYYFYRRRRDDLGK